MRTELTRDLAEKFAALALAHVSREYPNKLDHIMADAADALSPRALHPIFFGSYDWHSCVHGYWLLTRLTRRYPDLDAAEQIAALFEERMTTQNVATECAYLARSESRGFERPYGWGWLLKLHAELTAHGQRFAQHAAANLRPLADAFAGRFRGYLPLCDYPVRTGVHSSTAFALRLAADFADSARDAALFALMREKIRAWHDRDANAQAWEPSQDDFLSPTLMTAACMRRFLQPNDFCTWFASYLPRAADGEPASLFAPARVSDRSDGKIAHLDGLNFSRAWCWREIAAAFQPESALARCAHDAAERHIAASLPHVAGDYMGEHWLASFALLALEA